MALMLALAVVAIYLFVYLAIVFENKSSWPDVFVTALQWPVLLFVR